MTNDAHETTSFAAALDAAIARHAMLDHPFFQAWSEGRLELDVLRRWIEEGGEWSIHWAYRAPERIAPPEVDAADQATVRARRRGGVGRVRARQGILPRRVRRAGCRPAVHQQNGGRQGVRVLFACD